MSKHSNDLRQEAFTRIDFFERHIDNDDPDVRETSARSLAVAKAKALLSISEELAGIRQALDERQIQQNPS
ncbi:Uncharacterised protein [Mycobacteroides abscessus subsp. abscessus]|uniref:hypothetical protein n=1 Tax=Mycobacteroides abscessus TaxID=36809 RepID=UPI0009260187|nr:hypothetical protein [Mycobacteroides abscessus]SIM00792.1 Uncharacterised protein [Mycobacteroides abscessus subsp. abscessus]